MTKIKIGNNDSFPLTLLSIQEQFALRYECTKVVRKYGVDITVYKQVHIVNLQKGNAPIRNFDFLCFLCICLIVKQISCLVVKQISCLVVKQISHVCGKSVRINKPVDITSSLFFENVWTPDKHSITPIQSTASI